MTGPGRSTRRLTRRSFLIGGAGVAAAAGAYTLAGWIEQETYQPPAHAGSSAPAMGNDSPASQPIAILIDPEAAGSFGAYLGEALRAEGINAFQFESVTSVEADTLSHFSLVLLPPMTLTAGQASALSDYVLAGGALIAMRPDASIAPLFGVRPAAGATSGGYLVVRGEAIPLQVHAEASHYTLDGAEAIAELYRDRSTPTGFPAIATYESGGGRTAMFAFDLAFSIALLRQGNPSAANQEHDGAAGVRANDMFVSWIDLDNIDLPQADTQARLLVTLIESALRDRMPLPRLWHFPGNARSLIVLTGDAHAVPDTFIEETLQLAESYGGCGTVYYTPPMDESAIGGLRRSLARLPLMGFLAPDRGGRPTPDTVQAWRARGHEFGMHPYVEDGVDEGYVRCLRAFRREGYAPASPTVRTHRILWSGWVETARVQARRGLRMNVDYYHVGPAFQAADGSWPAGHFIGSGLPMKFVDEQGEIVDVYQQPTQLVDEHWLATTNRGWAGLDGEQAAQVARGLIDRCVDGAYAALAIQYHMDFSSRDKPDYRNANHWLESILSYARDKGLPIWSAERWLAFVEARHDLQVSDLRWDAASTTLSFGLHAPQPFPAPFSILVPAEFGGQRLAEAQVDGRPARHTTDGRYAWIEMTAESRAVTARYENA